MTVFIFRRILDQNCQLFCSKINDSSWVRTTRFSSSRFVVRVSVVPNIFTIYPKKFRYRQFSGTQHKRVPLRNVSVLWDKKYSTENLDTPLSIHKLFRYRKFSETQHRRVALRSFSVLRAEKKIDRQSWQNPLKQNILWYPKLATH